MMTASNPEQFFDGSSDPAVRGFLHVPDRDPAAVLVLAHGAGSNANSPLLIALADAFTDCGIATMRCNLPFRQLRSFGPPRPGDAARDRAGLLNAVLAMRKHFSSAIYLGGQSYGGRQASMLVAEQPELVRGLFLTSYPLHPPGNDKRMRTEHFPGIQVPALFVQGARDPFGSIEQIEAARQLIPAETSLLVVDEVGHDLGFSRRLAASAKDLPNRAVTAFLQLMGLASRRKRA